MQEKQNEINNAKNSVNNFLNSTDSSNYSAEKSHTLGVGSMPIDYSLDSFDSKANAEATMEATSALDTSSVPKEVSPPADSSGGRSRVQINLLPNYPCETIDNFDVKRQRGRPDITFFERLQIASRFWDPLRAWGEVTSLATEFHLSRQSIYNISYHIQSLLTASPIRTAPITQSPPPIPSILFTRQDILNLRTRLILTSVFPGGVTMRPLEDILAEVPFVDSPSDTTIWRIVNQAGEQADEILSQVDYSQIDLPPVLVAVDETFFNGYPILLVVEPTSLAVCAYHVPPDSDRGAASWNALLELLKEEQNLNIVGGLGDAAVAYPKAFKDLFEKKGGFQEDSFHLLYAIGRLCSSLERQAYAAIQKVEDYVHDLQKENSKKEEILKKLEKARIEEDKKISLYDNFFKISTWVSDGLEMVDWRSGEVRDREINEWLLDFAIEKMELLEHEKIQKMSRRIKKHKKNLLTYLDWLAKYLTPLQNELHKYLNDSSLEKYLLQLTAQYWRIKHFVESEKKTAWRPLMEHLNEQLQSDIIFDEYLLGWVTKVQKLLEWAQRTSSAVENVNGILKPMIKRKKRFSNSQNMEYFIALFALWHNLRVFKEGKRKGKSPFEILGIDLGQKDWKTLLGYKPVE